MFGWAAGNFPARDITQSGPVVEAKLTSSPSTPFFGATDKQPPRHSYSRDARKYRFLTAATQRLLMRAACDRTSRKFGYRESHFVGLYHLVPTGRKAATSDTKMYERTVRPHVRLGSDGR